MGSAGKGVMGVHTAQRGRSVIYNCLIMFAFGALFDTVRLVS